MSRLVCRAALVCLVATFGLVACGRDTGPSLSAQIVEQRLEPTATTDNANEICCCRVRGSVQNTSDINVNVNLSWKARDAEGADLGTALDLVSNLNPGETRDFDGSGIFFSCSRVSTLERRVQVVGLYHPELDE